MGLLLTPACCSLVALSASVFFRGSGKVGWFVSVWFVFFFPPLLQHGLFPALESGLTAV